MVYPLILGDKKTGVTLMQMVEKMDAGPIIDQVEYDIQPQDRRPDLEKKTDQSGI
jgi:methionyl-tRNA formyltransferase